MLSITLALQFFMNTNSTYLSIEHQKYTFPHVMILRYFIPKSAMKGLVLAMGFLWGGCSGHIPDDITPSPSNHSPSIVQEIPEVIDKWTIRPLPARAVLQTLDGNLIIELDLDATSPIGLYKLNDKTFTVRNLQIKIDKRYSRNEGKQFEMFIVDYAVQFDIDICENWKYVPGTWPGQCGSSVKSRGYTPIKLLMRRHSTYMQATQNHLLYATCVPNDAMGPVCKLSGSIAISDGGIIVNGHLKTRSSDD